MSNSAWSTGKNIAYVDAVPAGGQNVFVTLDETTKVTTVGTWRGLGVNERIEIPLQVRASLALLELGNSRHGGEWGVQGRRHGTGSGNMEHGKSGQPALNADRECVFEFGVDRGILDQVIVLLDGLPDWIATSAAVYGQIREMHTDEEVRLVLILHLSPVVRARAESASSDGKA